MRGGSRRRWWRGRLRGLKISLMMIEWSIRSS